MELALIVLAVAGLAASLYARYGYRRTRCPDLGSPAQSTDGPEPKQ